MAQFGLDNFVANPLDLLCEIIRTLDANSRSALALIFMHSGILPSPIEIGEEERSAIFIGGSAGGVREALNALNESLLIQSFQNNSHAWRFKHPTIRDAFATLIAENTELMDIYLSGTPIEKLFEEVSCGDVGIQGVKVIIPSSRYDALLTRIEKGDLKKNGTLYQFLAYRCDREFLTRFIERQPKFISNLQVWSYLYAVWDVDVIVGLHEFGLLPEEKRIGVVAAIQKFGR